MPRFNLLVLAALATLTNVAAVGCDTPEDAKPQLELRLGDAPAVEIDLPVADELELPQGAEARPCTSPELPLTLTVRDPDEQTLWQHHGCATEEQFDETLESLPSDDETSFRVWPKAYYDRCAQGSDYYCCVVGGGGWTCIILL